MKKNVMLIFACALLMFSCKDKNTYDPAYLTGAWQCEESGSISAPRHYQVDITRSDYDSTIYIVNNFYKTGYNTEIYFSANDSVIDIPSQNIEQYLFSGHGKISIDFKRIELEYEATIPEGVDVVSSVYTR